MASGSRTLKLSILADIDNLKKNLGQADTEVQGFGGKLEKFGKVAAAAFAAAAAAAAAYAGKLAIEGVKAAIEDEAAQARLAKALESVTGATKEQTAEVEKQIEKMSLSFGVADEQLRPAFQRLATATGSLSEAQKGLQLALDISAATGKSVEAVSNALGKAYEGNTSSLTRLGIGLSSAEVKALGLEGTMRQLSDTFAGAATTQANTLEGQINRLKVRFEETKEAVGVALLPAVILFVDYLTNRLIPLLIEAKDKALAPMKQAFEDNRDAIEDLWAFTKDYLVPLFEFTLVRAIEGVGKALATITNIIGAVVRAIEGLVNRAISAINTMINAYNSIPFLGNVGALSYVGGSTGAGLGSRPMGGSKNQTESVLSGLTDVINSMTDILLGGSGSKNRSGGTSNDKRVIKHIRAAQNQYREIVAMNDALNASLNPVVSSAPIGNAASVVESGLTINVNGPSVIDETGFTRAIINALNSLERRQGGGASQLIGLP